jgi:superfamily II DNA/RNA helicase
MENVERIDFLEENNPLGSRINKFFLRSESADKLTSLGNLLCSFGRARSIVYAGFRESVERISSYLREEGFVVASLHGGLEQEERNEAVYLFLNKSANILVSTNLSSRGLDLPDVDNIIHYHLPETSGDYIHRSGRTARWEAEGNTYFILSPSEQLPDYVGDDVIECCLPESLPEVALPEFSTIYIGKGKQDKISRGDVLGFLCKKGGLSSKEIGRIDVYDRYSRVAVSREKMKTLLRRLEGEKIKGVKTKVEELKRII